MYSPILASRLESSSSEKNKTLIFSIRSTCSRVHCFPDRHQALTDQSNWAFHHKRLNLDFCRNCFFVKHQVPGNVLNCVTPENKATSRKVRIHLKPEEEVPPLFLACRRLDLKYVCKQHIHT